MTHQVRFPPCLPQGKIDGSRIRLTLPSGLCPGAQFEGLNTMYPQSYS